MFISVSIIIGVIGLVLLVLGCVVYSCAPAPTPPAKTTTQGNVGSLLLALGLIAVVIGCVMFFLPQSPQAPPVPPVPEDLLELKQNADLADSLSDSPIFNCRLTTKVMQITIPGDKLEDSEKIKWIAIANKGLKKAGLKEDAKAICVIVQEAYWSTHTIKGNLVFERTSKKGYKTSMRFDSPNMAPDKFDGWKTQLLDNLKNYITIKGGKLPLPGSTVPVNPAPGGGNSSIFTVQEPANFSFLSEAKIK